MITNNVEQAILSMLEDILKNQKKPQAAVIDPAPLNDLSAKLDIVATNSNESSQRINEAVEILSKPIKTECRHFYTVDFRSNRALLWIFGAVALFIVMCIVMNNQLRTIAQYRESDLKYRYVKMTSGITGEDLLELETVFVYNRDPKAVKALRKRVENYERLLREQAEKIEQARLNATQAEQLKHETEALKNKK